MGVLESFYIGTIGHNGVTYAIYIKSAPDVVRCRDYGTSPDESGDSPHNNLELCMSNNRSDTEQFDGQTDGGGGSAAEQFEDLIRELVDAEDWDVLDILEAALGAAVAKNTVNLDIPDFGNAANDSFWSQFEFPNDSVKDRLEHIHDKWLNDPEWDQDKWSKLVKHFSTTVAGTGVGAVLNIYSYYVVWQEIEWIRDNTHGWSADDFVRTFGQLIEDVPFVVIDLFANMFVLYESIQDGSQSMDEAVFPRGIDRWDPAPVPVRTGTGVVRVTKPRDKFLKWEWSRPDEYLRPSGDWVSDLKDSLRADLRDWFDKEVEFGSQPEPAVDPYAPPGVLIEIPTGRKSREAARRGILTINLRQWDVDPVNQSDPAEKWRKRIDRKMSGAWLYVGFLRLLNKTYGQLDEISDVWGAIEDNLVVELKNGEIVFWNDLSARGKILVLNSLGHGVRLNIDGDGLIFDLFFNELIDRTVGAMSKAEREWLRQEGIGGIFDSGNMSTWWKRWERTTQAIEEQRSNESDEPGKEE